MGMNVPCYSFRGTHMGQVHLARVDERLVHGQVMTNLSKSAGANSIFIVDDGVAKDAFMKMIFVNSGSRTVFR